MVSVRIYVVSVNTGAFRASVHAKDVILAASDLMLAVHLARAGDLLEVRAINVAS